MATRGFQFTFHGAYKRKSAAEQKVAKLGGTKRARILGRHVGRSDFRYVVVTK